MSEHIGDLSAALAKAQGEFKPAKKNCTNPHFRNKYADLTSLKEATKEALAKNSLCVIQTTHDNGDEIEVWTILAHASGQWIRSVLPLIIDKQNMQGMGSALTYAIRYSYASVTGISSEEDDDATEAVNAAPKTSGLPGTTWKSSQLSQNKTMKPPMFHDAEKPSTLSPDSEPTGGPRKLSKDLEDKMLLAGMKKNDLVVLLKKNIEQWTHDDEKKAIHEVEKRILNGL